MLTIYGLVVFAGIFGGMLWANARRWRYLSRGYAGDIGVPIEKRSMQSVVLLGLGGFNSLNGIVTLGVHETGLSLRILLPFSLFHSPLFVPYGDIEGWKTSWYLNAPSAELEFSRAPLVKMVMPAEQAEWIQDFAGRKVIFHEEMSPAGSAGRGWRFLLLIYGAVSIGMLIWVFGHFLAVESWLISDVAVK